jgi:hypothetical protein
MDRAGSTACILGRGHQPSGPLPGRSSGRRASRRSQQASFRSAGRQTTPERRARRCAAEEKMNDTDARLWAPLAPHQPHSARHAAHALERGGVGCGQGRVQARARVAERDPACGVTHHVQGLDVLGRRRRRWWRTPRTRAGCLPDSGNCWYLRAQSTDARNSTALVA